MSAHWIDATKSLPKPNERVQVKGYYVPPGMGFPTAYRREERGGGWRWESTEFRGTCGITYWRKLATKPAGA